MPNIKNAKKAVKVQETKSVRNNYYKASMKTAVKNVEKAVVSKDKDKAQECLKVAVKRIDKAASVGVATDNYKARMKSRLTKKVNAM